MSIAHQELLCYYLSLNLSRAIHWAASMATCLQAKGLSAEYYLYKDEGHGFARPPNKFDFYSRVEQFLSKHLGGRAEPLMKVEGSSVVIMHES